MIVDRYFAIHPDFLNKFHAALVPDNDVLPYDIIPNAKQLVTLSDGRVLVHLRLGQRHLEAMQELAECADPLSIDAVVALDLAVSYVGKTRDEVLAALPELEGTKTIEYTDPDTGETVTREEPLLPRHEWR